MPLSADAIASLFDRHGSDVLRYLARRTIDPEAAVDLTAETFARAITEREQFRGDSETEALGWVYTIARNLLLNFIERNRVEKEAMQRLGHRRRALQTDEQERIELLIDLAGLRDQVAAALDDLPRRQRDALRLRVLEERPYADVAARIGVSEQTARRHVSWGLRRLRRSPLFVAWQREQTHD